MQKNNFFTQQLLIWSAANPRPLPWKAIKNPYFIWLSEIILQQTRVEQGMPYYLHFKETYPTVKDLADAPEDQVMKSWEGLGYYSRARNLHKAAKYIAYDCKEVFPDDYENILKINGVGPYTAAAIASFAFDLPHAVVDGNVYRVLARFFGIEAAIDSTEGVKKFRELAQELLDKSHPARYNQAIMDFGATHCMPKKPLCGTCNFKSECAAFNTDKIELLPIKSKKIIKKDRFFSFFYIKNNQNKIFIKKRIEKDIWQNLYDFPLWESDFLLENDDLEKVLEKEILKNSNFKITKTSKPYKHILTHQNLFAQFVEITVQNDLILENEQVLEIFEYEIKKFAFPKLFDLYFKDKNVSLYLF